MWMRGKGEKGLGGRAPGTKGYRDESRKQSAGRRTLVAFSLNNDVNNSTLIALWPLASTRTRPAPSLARSHQRRRPARPVQLPGLPNARSVHSTRPLDGHEAPVRHPSLSQPPHERALHLRPPTCRPCESPRPPPPAHHALTPPTAATSSPSTPRPSSARTSSSRATSPLAPMRLRATFLRIRFLTRSCDHSHTWPMQAPSSTQRRPSLPSQGPS